MKKIILVANTEWYLYNFRRNLGLFLREHGFDVLMVSPPGEYARKLEDLGFRWRLWDVGRKTVTPWGEIRAMQDLEQIYREERPDIVHHHTIKPCLYGSIAARRQEVPVIVNSITGRGYVFIANDVLAWLLRRVVEPLYRYAFAPVHCGVIFENQVDKDFFIERRLTTVERTWLVESVGVDVQRFRPEPEPEGPVKIVFASRMLWDKGVGVLVDAARLLQGRTSAQVVLFGSPDPGNPASIPEETLLKWQEEGLVEWRGFEPDMNKAYNEGHIVAFPSMYGEGVPTVLIEAGACGRPLVTTRMPGCQDVVEDGVNGFLVPPGDAPALANALARLVDDPQLRRVMGEAARQRVLERFTVEAVNEATLAVYRQIEQEKHGNG